MGGWVSRGRRLPRRGRSQEAGLVFGRILVREPGHAGARQGRREAEAAEAEQERRALVRLEEGERALLAGDVARGRDLTVEGVPTAGDHERAGERPPYHDPPRRPAASPEGALAGAQ